MSDTNQTSNCEQSDSVNKRQNVYNKAHYSKKLQIESNLKGFLFTYSFNEKVSVREAYQLLNLFTEGEAPANHNDEEQTKNPEQTISGALDDELNELRTKAKAVKDKKFQAITPGAKYVIFIRTTVPEPIELAERIMAKAAEQKTKYLLRMTPVDVTCKANHKVILDAIKPFVQKYFKVNEFKTFAIIVNKRNCSDALDKMQIIKDVADLVASCNPNVKVNLKQPDLAIIIDVIRSWTFVGFAKQYYHFKKYNLQQLVKE